MSKLGYIISSYGSEFNIAVANTTSYNVINSNQLPANTMIISAPCDEDKQDNDKFSIIITDSYGNPSRISYSIKEGNGLYMKNDFIEMSLDNDTLVSSYNKISLNVMNLIDDETIMYKNDKLSINLDNIQKASSSKFGICKVDNKTIKSNNGELYVNTEELDLASNNIPGIVKGDGNTVFIKNGEASINVNNLDKCSYTSYGVFKPDNISLISNNGVLSLNSTYFQNYSYASLIKVDDTTISSTNGTLSINSNNLKKASSTESGLVLIGNEFIINSNGQLVMISNFDTSYISYIQNRINSINAKLDNIEEEINK